MKIVVVTPTCRWGGLDVNLASLRTQDCDFTWLITDELYDQRGWPDLPVEAPNIEVVVKPQKRFGLASGYNQAIEFAREQDADVLVSMQDYLWIPSGGVSYFARMAQAYGSCLLTALMPKSRDPYPDAVGDPRGPFTVFKQPYDGHKPQDIDRITDIRESWVIRTGPRQSVYHVPVEWWEPTWAAIPRTILHDDRLSYDEDYDAGFGHESNGYAREADRLGYERLLLMDNSAVGLPHNSYFPDLHRTLLDRKPPADAHYEMAHAQ